MYAASLGDTPVMQAILDKEADITAKDHVGRTALHYCCKGGNVQNFKALKVAMGANIAMNEQRTVGGMTPLMFAIESQNRQMVIECLTASFDPFAKDYCGKSVLQYAYHCRRASDWSIYGFI